MYTRGKTSVQSFYVLMNAVTLKTLCMNVFRMFRQRFMNIFRTFCQHFQNVLSTFSERFVNIFRTFCQHFQNVLSAFSERFVNIFRTFCQRFQNRSENVHTVRILCIVRKLLTRPFQRHLT
jgi:uncharacterized protein YggT (Ycf19 family)